jgi:hypothetical protein
MDDREQNEVVKCTKALLLFQLQATASPEEQVKPEVLLARAGFAARDIAPMLGKKVTAVAKTLQRAGKGGE